MAALYRLPDGAVIRVVEGTHTSTYRRWDGPVDGACPPLTPSIEWPWRMENARCLNRPHGASADCDEPLLCFKDPWGNTFLWCPRCGHILEFLSPERWCASVHHEGDRP